VVLLRYSAHGLGKSCAQGKLCPPSCSDELKGRIGDDAFRHIILNVSLFLPVQNNCFMQLSGEPVYERYQHRPSQVVQQRNDVPQASARRWKKKSKVAANEPVVKVLKRAVIPR
jgi:hypothetical protein